MAPVVAISPSKPKAPKANTDSGYHGMSEDDMDTDELLIPTAPPIHVLDGTRESSHSQLSLPETAEFSGPPTERAPTTEGSFHSAREEPIEHEDLKAITQDTVPITETQSLDALPEKVMAKVPSMIAPPPVQADAMQLDEVDEGSMLEDHIDESRSPSQGSSPVKHLVRKSSLTFAALPAREPLTTKKSIGARVSRTSHVDQAKNALSRGSFLGRFTSGKSLGATKQVEVDNLRDGGEMEVDQAIKPGLEREETDGDAKMAKLHNKSSTQRLHDKISMLGQSARPTKSIPAAAIVTNPSYPELPQADLQTLPTQRSFQAPEPIPKSMDDDDDDWIKPPPSQSHQASRPPLPKSTTVDVMENIRGKQNVGDKDFGPGYYDDDAFKDHNSVRPDVVPNSETNVLGLARSASAAVLPSPSRTQAPTAEDHVGMNAASDTRANDHGQFAASTTPAGTPRSKQNIDGPISASKSKLQSIMKTARGLFTSSAGVSAQAKMEALSSPSTRTRSKVQENDSGNSVDGVSKIKDGMTVQQSSGPGKESEGRKTRSSTEKEEKRKEQAEQVYVASKEAVKAEPNERKVVQPLKTTRQSPRRPQQQPTEAIPVAEGDGDRPSDTNRAGLESTVGPPQPQTSQPQRSKDPRRPIKPAKEAASKPKPQTIRVGPLSQQPRIPLSNAALSSSLQESLPAAQTRPPGLVKKASNASIQTSTSNHSLKSSATSAVAKPKALVAAERKKEQVCDT